MDFQRMLGIGYLLLKLSSTNKLLKTSGGVRVQSILLSVGIRKNQQSTCDSACESRRHEILTDTIPQSGCIG